MARAGRLRHYVTIKLPSTTLTTRGQITGSDTIVASDVPCEIVTLSGRELEQARSTMASATHRITARAMRDVTLTTKHKLVYGTRTFNIGAIDDVDQKSFEWRLTCGEEV